MPSMSEALLRVALPPTNQPLRLAVRRFRWFKLAFHAHVEAYGHHLGCTFAIDNETLAEVFVQWLEAIDRQNPRDKAKRRAFFEFAACLMLRELISNLPIHRTTDISDAKSATVGAFWPEGYACTMFCLSIHSAAMKQEFDYDIDVSPSVEDLRSWWSFKENSAESRSFPAGFLRKLLGHEPNWSMPDVFRAQL